jgi:hypothetical protein
MNFLHVFIFNSKKRQRISWTYRSHSSVLPALTVPCYSLFPKITHWHRCLCFIVVGKNCSIHTLHAKMLLRIPLFSLPNTRSTAHGAFFPINFHAYFKNLIKNS